MDDPTLAAELGGDKALQLMRCDRAITDCRPVSLFSLQSARQLSEELGRVLDVKRFRANLVIDIAGEGFGEDALVGKTIRIGDRATLTVLERDARCAMIGIDPDTGERDRDIPGWVAKAHGNIAGVYAAVLVEGIVRPGDGIVVLG